MTILRPQFWTIIESWNSIFFKKLIVTILFISVENPINSLFLCFVFPSADVQTTN